MPSDKLALLDDLRHAVGMRHVLHDGDLSAFEQDWRQRHRGRALAVVLPATTGEVAAVVRACARHGAPIVPQGGNTGLVVGSVPDESGQQIVLSLRRMRKVRALDEANATITVEAGCILQEVQQAAEQAGLLFPLSLAAEGSCTIGGNLSTNAGGTQVLRYGNARELCLGIEAVTAHGAIWDGLTGLRKDNTGYDLRDLLIGSEGTLGIITAATLKLYPQPVARLTAWAGVADLDQATALLGLAQKRLAASLTGFEVMGAFALSLVARHHPHLPRPLPQPPEWSVLMELSDHASEAHARAEMEALLSDAIDAGVVDDAVIAESIEQSRRLWQVRETIPLAQVDEGPNIKHDISVPISRIASFVRDTDAALQAAFPGIRLVTFGHLGDGNLHYNVQAPQGMSGQAFLAAHEKAVNELVYRAVADAQGSISAEHGIGSLKRDELPHYKSPVALELMRAIKQALDPKGIMNPGRIL